MQPVLHIGQRRSHDRVVEQNHELAEAGHREQHAPVGTTAYDRMRCSDGDPSQSSVAPAPLTRVAVHLNALMQSVTALGDYREGRPTNASTSCVKVGA
ncbi:hypothetical protein GCM10010394_23280 [Streptomyces crystallinus]|uniref:Uncharacterized protein n=1 Tax=Streptomyces crystallinus TaxID=68191 RepID=A0ABP3QPY2_9ACTN